MVWASIRQRFDVDRTVRPEIHSTEQKKRDLAKIGLFPNPAQIRGPELEGESIYRYGILSVSSSRGGLFLLDGRRVKKLEEFEIYHLKRVKAGSHELIIMADGFEDVRETIHLRPDRNLALDYDPQSLESEAY